jgi:TIR domain-containing protein
MSAVPSKYEFDLFVSYSHKDTGWVKDKLVPKLGLFEAAFAIDFINFEGARSIQSEMVRLMRASRRTLIVLSKNWLSSNWTMFEAQSTRTFQLANYADRLVVLQLEPCTIPELLKDVTTIAIPAIGEGRAFGRLRRVVLGGRISRGGSAPLNGGLTFWKKHASPNWHGGRHSNYEYAFDADIECRVPIEIQFDSLIVRVVVPPGIDIPDDAMDTIQVVTGGGQTTTLYSNRGIAGLPEIDSETVVEAVMLKGPKGIRFHRISAPLCSSKPGVCTLQLAMSLYYADTRVSNEVACALPPVNRLPENGSPGLGVPCVPVYCLPAASGISNSSTAAALLDTAAEFSKDSVLLAVSPITMTL